MVFNSVAFAVFIFIFFNIYWFVNNSFSPRVRNLFTLGGSYLFYGWWDWRFLTLIAVSSLTDYLLGLKIDAVSNGKTKRLFLIVSLMVNLGILGVFKYFNFFIDSFHEVLSLFSLNISITTLSIILPVGISFYTFQTLSYTIDIYRGKLKPTKDPILFFTFVAFFPQLVAGPIERAKNLLHQFEGRKVFDYRKIIGGLQLILWGLFKKIVIADNLGLIADSIFGSNDALSSLTVLIGSVVFGFQIYCDFSGYSDIAIGISKTLGIDLLSNFKSPYFATSLTSFWHRWHISLSTWFRDYVYIPLGGGRVSVIRGQINIFVTFLLSGLWHGANVTFLIWGGVHGALLTVEKKVNFNLSKFIALPLTFLVTSLLWIPFRAEDFVHLKKLTSALVFNLNVGQSIMTHFLGIFNFEKLAILGITFLIFLIVESRMGLNDFSKWISSKSTLFRRVVYYSLVLAILILGNFAAKPYFIYFQF